MSPNISSALDWLLEESNPSVRYFTLIELFEREEADREVQDARRAIVAGGPALKVLAKQSPEGCWGRPGDFYIRSKYKGTVWSFLLLAQLGVPGEDERLGRACEFILEHSQDPHSGGFAYMEAAGRGGHPDKILPCLTGNLLWCLVRFGRLEDPRVQQGIGWILAFQRYDDGEGPAPRGWPYEHYPQCWGEHTCMMGVVKTLKALAEIPAGCRSPEIEAAIARGEQFLLEHRLYRRSHATGQPAKSEWETFSYPRMWNTDALEMLEVLSRLGCRDARMQDAVDLVLSKRDDQGRWLMEGGFNGRMLATIERRGQPSKWVTLSALRTLKRLRLES